MANLKPIQQKQFLVFFDGSALLSTYFTKVTAPKESRDEVEYNNGQDGTTYTSLGFTKRDKVTFSKPFDPVADKAIITWYKGRRAASTEKFTATIKPVNADQAGSDISGAGTLTLTGCEVVSFKMPEADRMSTGLAMLEIEVVHDDWSFS